MNETEIITSIEEYYKKNKIHYQRPDNDDNMSEIYACYVVHPDDAPETLNFPIQNVIQIFDGFMLVSTVFDPNLETVLRQSKHKPTILKLINFLNSNIYLPMVYNPRFTLHTEVDSQFAVETMVPAKLFELDPSEFMDATSSKIPALMVDLIPVLIPMAEGKIKFEEAVEYIEHMIMGRHQDHHYGCGCNHDHHHEHEHTHNHSHHECDCGHHH